MKKIEKSIDFGGRKLTLSTGHVAAQATGAVMASYGETVCLVTVVAAPLKEDPGFFPLMVDYRERLSAGGRIKGSRWVKREGRPTDEEILTARLIDRSIRPLFPEKYDKEIQVIIQVLSVDMENTPDMVAAIAASAAIEASTIYWNGPVAVVRVGLKEGKEIINPLHEDLTKSDMDLIISLTKDAIVMIEAKANEIPEKQILDGINIGQKEGLKLIKFIEDFAKEVGIKKDAVQKDTSTAGVEKKIKELADKKMSELITKIATKETGYADLDELKKAVGESFDEKDKRTIEFLFDKLFRQKIRTLLLSGKRPDGRKQNQIRDLSAGVGILPRVHGSAIFKRGQTQALTVVTLGAPSLEQLIETAEGEEKKRYIHHYSMPPYSLGEIGRYGFPSRREIGHGVLAERALMPVIPGEQEFPYTIHLVTEVLSSNGSTSMAAVCGSTLSLMDAGVPIKAPVAGIAVGLVIESEAKHTILTDIVGLEDGGGDMDFKVAGTKDGVTTLQLDVKTLKLNQKILTKALEQAKKARLEILAVIQKAIAKPRDKVSTYAPKIKVLIVPKDKIGEVIGPGGRIIRKIIAETGAQVEVDDDGKVNISGVLEEKVEAAFKMVESLVKNPTVGEIHDGEVTRIQPFGAHVEISPGKEGLVHVSDMSTEFVKKPQDIVSVGDKVKVRVKEIDSFGRLNLSMVLDESKDKASGKRFGDRKSGRGFESRKPKRKFERRGRRDRGNRSSGPHFPATRLLKDN